MNNILDIRTDKIDPELQPVAHIVEEMCGSELQLQFLNKWQQELKTLEFDQTFLGDKLLKFSGTRSDVTHLVSIPGLEMLFALKKPAEQDNTWATLSQKQRYSLLSSLAYAFTRANAPKVREVQLFFGIKIAENCQEWRDLGVGRVLLEMVFPRFVGSPIAKQLVLDYTQWCASLSQLPDWTLSPSKCIQSCNAGVPIGVCRHSAAALACLLFELGVPASDIRIVWGFKRFTRKGHLWLEVITSPEETPVVLESTAGANHALLINNAYDRRFPKTTKVSLEDLLVALR